MMEIGGKTFCEIRLLSLDVHYGDESALAAGILSRDIGETIVECVTTPTQRVLPYEPGNF